MAGVDLAPATAIIEKDLMATTARARRTLAPLWLLTPAGLVIIALTVVPILFLVFTSFTDYSQRTLFTGAFNGVWFANYAKTLSNPEFWFALIRTLVFTAAMVVGTIAIGMAVAQLLGRLGAVMRYIVTVVLIFAWAIPNVASSVVWAWLFQPGYGIINWLLTQTHLFGDLTSTNWAQNTWLAYAEIWFLIVWQAVPFVALTLYASHTQIDPAYFEAARLDGASEWRIYWTITLEFLRPTLLLVTILSIIWDFNVFNQIWLISRGGPEASTSTLGVFTYTTAFVGNHYGSSAAIAVITTALLMGITAVYVRNLVRSGEEL